MQGHREPRVETDDQAALLEEIVTQMHLSPVFEGRLMQAVTDYYCRKASEDKDGDGVFNCAYLVQIDKNIWRPGRGSRYARP